MCDMKLEPFRRLAARMQYIMPFEVMEIQTIARQLEAQGHDVIHMEIGEPDFATPQPIIDAALRALSEKPMLYTSALGIMPLRESIAAFYESQYADKRQCDPSLLPDALPGWCRRYECAFPAH